MVSKYIVLSVLIILASTSHLESKIREENVKMASDSAIKSTSSNGLLEEEIERFFVIGDYGDLDQLQSIEYMTNIMGNLSEKKNFDFITTVGDNFYPDGIESMDDLKAANKIMSYFQKPAIKPLKMYPTLGNHDCTVDYSNEIKYSEINDQWEMESDYYELKRPLKDDPSKHMVILMSNSCLLTCWNIAETDTKRRNKCEKMKIVVGEQRVIDHYNWIEEKLKIYSKDPQIVWVGVAMHHPVLKEAALKNDLLPLLQKYKVDFALVGHAHQFEYSNIGYGDELKYPDSNYGPILEDCVGRNEIFNTGNLDHSFKKGETLHQVLIGSSGTELDDICPYKDQDGDVYFQSIDGHGLVTVEVNSQVLRFGFYKDFDDDFFNVEIRV